MTASEIICPQAQHAKYASREYDNASFAIGSEFVIICDTDFSGNGSVDLVSKEVGGAADCFDWCSVTTGCKGGVYGVYGGVKTCWLKSALGTPKVLLGFYFGLSESESSA